MDFAKIFAVSFLSFYYSKVYCRPQWYSTPDPNKRFTLSKKFSFNNKRSSIGVNIGYGTKSGLQFGLNASHKLPKETKIQGSFSILEGGGYQHNLEVSKKLKNGMRLKTNYKGSNTGGNKISVGFAIPIKG